MATTFFTFQTIQETKKKLLKMISSIRNYFTVKNYQSEVSTSTIEPWERVLFSKFLFLFFLINFSIYFEVEFLTNFSFLFLSLSFLLDSVIAMSITLFMYTAFANFPEQNFNFHHSIGDYHSFCL